MVERSENFPDVVDQCCTPGRGVGAPGDTGAGTVPHGGLQFLGSPTFPGSGAGSIDWVVLNGGAFLMGSDDVLAYSADLEGPVRSSEVTPFRISATAVTVGQFAEFVESTGYQTEAERFGDSLVFHLEAVSGSWPAVASVPWWFQVVGANWRHPQGKGGINALQDRFDHPVVHVSHNDALAYCAWAGVRLPSEMEWEFAARGGLVQHPYPWGSELEPGGRHLMNVWQGNFPVSNTAEDGFEATAPVRTYPPNGFGMYEMTGNVWEWTSSIFSPSRGDVRPVIRGGSYLCHDSYCRRYRVSARSANTADTSTGHTGFRVAMD